MRKRAGAEQNVGNLHLRAVNRVIHLCENAESHVENLHNHTGERHHGDEVRHVGNRLRELSGPRRAHGVHLQREQNRQREANENAVKGQPQRIAEDALKIIGTEKLGELIQSHPGASPDAQPDLVLPKGDLRAQHRPIAEYPNRNDRIRPTLLSLSAFEITQFNIHIILPLSAIPQVEYSHFDRVIFIPQHRCEVHFSDLQV